MVPKLADIEGARGSSIAENFAVQRANRSLQSVNVPSVFKMTARRMS